MASLPAKSACRRTQSSARLDRAVGHSPHRQPQHRHPLERKWKSLHLDRVALRKRGKLLEDYRWCPARIAHRRIADRPPVGPASAALSHVGRLRLEPIWTVQQPGPQPPLAAAEYHQWACFPRHKQPKQLALPQAACCEPLMSNRS